jgi:hypothetical protein
MEGAHVSSRWRRLGRAGLGLTVLAAGAGGAWGRQRSASPPEVATASTASKEATLWIVDHEGRSLGEAEVRVAVAGDVRMSMRMSFEFPTAPPASAVDGLVERMPVLHADAGGHVHCAWPSEHERLVVAKTDTLWGYAWFPKEPADGARAKQPIRIELAPDWPLEVRVVDANGRALGGQRVSVRGSQARLGGSSERPEPIVLDHVGYLLRDETEPARVVLDGLFAPPVEVALDPHARPSAPIVLRAPLFGALEVQLLPPYHVPEPETCRLTAELVVAPLPDAVRRFERRSPPQLVSGLDGGRAFFEPVGLDREIDVIVEASARWKEARTRVAGPTLPGGSVRVVVQLEPPGPPPEEPPTRAQPRDPGLGIVTGKALVDPAVPASTLDVCLRSRHLRRDEAGAWAEIHCLGPNDTFEFSDVPPGPATLEVLAMNASVLKLDLEVAAGANADARLAALDLRKLVHVRTIRVRGAVPEHPFHARVMFEPSHAQAQQLHHTHAFEAPVVLATPWSELDVQLFAPGYRSVALRDLREDVEVALEPGLPVRLRLHTDGALPAPPRYLKAVLVAPEAPFGIDWEGPAFGASREIVTRAFHPGSLYVQWIVAEVSADGSHGVDIAPAQSVEVLDTSGEQVFDLTISAAELARVLAER